MSVSSVSTWIKIKYPRGSCEAPFPRNCCFCSRSMFLTSNTRTTPHFPRLIEYFIDQLLSVSIDFLSHDAPRCIKGVFVGAWGSKWYECELIEASAFPMILTPMCLQQCTRHTVVLTEFILQCYHGFSLSLFLVLHFNSWIKIFTKCPCLL